MKYKIRLGKTNDIEFLREMLFEAVYWRPGIKRPPIKQGLSHPDISKILYGWGRKGDTAIIAESPEGRCIGAAWYRFWTDEIHSFGYVNKESPELGMAVVGEYRGKGIGSVLLKELIDVAAEKGIKKISLSVENDNPAVHLYRRHGFKKIGSLDNSWTMVTEMDK